MWIEGIEYEIVRACDLERDGMSLECQRVSASGELTLVMEAFWHDPTGRFTFWSCAEPLPFALVRAFVSEAACGCPPMRSDEAGRKTLIHVALLDEGTEVWRPVEAEIRSEGLYLITGAQPEDERWAFPPGALVRGKERIFQDGSLGLVATEYAS